VVCGVLTVVQDVHVAVVHSRGSMRRKCKTGHITLGVVTSSILMDLLSVDLIRKRDKMV